MGLAIAGDRIEIDRDRHGDLLISARRKADRSMGLAIELARSTHHQEHSHV
jgi:hypothetical protein